jgi:hypothetical protein
VGTNPIFFFSSRPWSAQVCISFTFLMIFMLIGSPLSLSLDLPGYDISCLSERCRLRKAPNAIMLKICMALDVLLSEAFILKISCCQ